MKALRIQVERVVRPICASNPRKDQMREELLAHLTRLFEEELARTGDIESATAEAIRRFGDARALSRELQEAVPWLERLAFFKFPVYGPLRRRRGESPLRFSLRMNCWGVAAGLACYSLAGLVAVTIPGRRPHRADQVTRGQALVCLACVAGIACATLFGWGLLSEGVRHELECRAAATTVLDRRKAIWRIVGYAVAGSALLGSAAAGFMLMVDAFLPVSIITRSGFWWVTVGAVALGPPSVLLHGRDQRAAARRFENWESLDLDEHRVA